MIETLDCFYIIKMASLFTSVFVMMTIGHTLHVLCLDDINETPPRNLSCTNDKPYTDCDTKNKTCICVKNCASHEVLDGKSCIPVAKCTKPILYDGQCLDMCPEGYIYIYDANYHTGVADDSTDTHTVNDLDIETCVTYESVEFKAAGIGTLIVAYIVIMVAFFSSKSFSLSSMKNAFRCRKKRKTNNDDEDDDDESDDDDLDHNVNCNVIIDDDDENHLL